MYSSVDDHLPHQASAVVASAPILLATDRAFPFGIRSRYVLPPRILLHDYLRGVAYFLRPGCTCSEMLKGVTGVTSKIGSSVLMRFQSDGDRDVFMWQIHIRLNVCMLIQGR